MTYILNLLGYITYKQLKSLNRDYLKEIDNLIKEVEEKDKEIFRLQELNKVQQSTWQKKYNKLGKK